MDVVKGVLSALPGIIFKKGKTEEQTRLEEDAELAAAIKAGDWKTVSRIKERRQHYGKTALIPILLMFSLLASGCAFFHPSPHKDVPLLEGEVVWPIKPGIYEDTSGGMHRATNSWVSSEADLFRAVRDIPEKPKPFYRDQRFQLGGLFGACAMVAFWLGTKTRKRDERRGYQGIRKAGL